MWMSQVWASPPGRWGIEPSPIWSCPWTIRGWCAWSPRAPSKPRRSNSSSTSPSTKPPQTTGRPGSVRVRTGSRASPWCVSHWLSLPADRRHPGKRQTCAETDLGRKRNEYRAGGDRWKVDSSKYWCYRGGLSPRAQSYLQRSLMTCMRFQKIRYFRKVMMQHTHTHTKLKKKRKCMSIFMPHTHW